jgi:hypothetical protein
MNVWLTLAIQIFAIGIALFNVVKALYDNRNNFSFIILVWKRFRLLMFIQILGIIALIYFTYAVLITLTPYFGYGWANLIAKGGGNILITPVFSAFNSTLYIVRSLPSLFIFAFLLSLPFMARLEENIFRRGVHTWKEITWRSIVFGLMHLIIGIPVGIGIALIIPGFFFAYIYRKTYLKQVSKNITQKLARNEAILESTAYHTMMNTIFIIYVLIICIINI